MKDWFKPLLIAVIVIVVLAFCVMSGLIPKSYGQEASSATEPSRAWQNAIREFATAQKRFREAENEYIWSLAQPIRSLNQSGLTQAAEMFCPAVAEGITLSEGYSQLLRMLLTAPEAKEYVRESDLQQLSVMPVVRIPKGQLVYRLPVTLDELHRERGEFCGFMTLLHHRDHTLINAFRFPGAELHLVLPNLRVRFNAPPTKAELDQLIEKRDLWKVEAYATFFNYVKATDSAEYLPVEIMPKAVVPRTNAVRIAKR